MTRKPIESTSQIRIGVVCFKAENNTVLFLYRRYQDKRDAFCRFTNADHPLNTWLLTNCVDWTKNNAKVN